MHMRICMRMRILEVYASQRCNVHLQIIEHYLDLTRVLTPSSPKYMLELAYSHACTICELRTNAILSGPVRMHTPCEQPSNTPCNNK